MGSQPSAPRHSQPKAETPRETKKPRTDKPRHERPAKPVDTWKLEDFVVEPQEGKTRFHDFRLAPELMHAIHDLGFPYCTPIQAQVLGHTLKGKDAIGRAQTGTGKTAAFLISTITQLLQTQPPKERYMGEPRALIIAPTRELVVQIAKDAEDLTKYTGLNVMQFVGGMDFDKQLKQLESRYCDILVATPGRLLDFNQRGDVHLDMVEVMVLDEADRRIAIPDFSFFVVCLQLQRETGGQLTEMLENLSQIIRTRRELGMKARALTAEGRTASKVIAAVPLCIMLALWIINPEYIGVLFSTPQGHTILYVAAAMGTAGLLLINRIARLEA